MKGLRRRIFGISPQETTFARRGFRSNRPHIRLRLEHVGQTFLQGYHAVLEEDDLELLTRSLHGVDAEFCGFAFEGAAMALALLDHLSLRPKNRLQTFLAGPGDAHAYMVHIGAGWAYARLPWLKARLERPLRRLDPLLGWLAVDGYGFHEGYFNWRRYIAKQKLPKRLSPYARRVFDQGLGRSFWFVEGADIMRLNTTLSAFAPERHADLWSGVGLACAYAGGVEPIEIEVLQQVAGPYKVHLAQGAAFAAKARQRAGNLTPHTEQACQILCGMAAAAAADITDLARQNLPSDQAEPAYEIWRQQIRALIAEETVLS